MRRTLPFLAFSLAVVGILSVSAKAFQERGAATVGGVALVSASSSVTPSKTSLFKRFRPAAAPFLSSLPAKRMGSASVPILVYHHVRPTTGYAKSTWSWKMSVTPSLFEKQMQWIADHGYTTVDLNEAARILRDEAPGPEKPVVITFDDNNLNAFENGFPILKKLGLTATWYVITNRFDKPTFLTTAQIKEMAKAGMDIQSHSATHPWLTSLSVTKQKWELEESRKAIEKITGKPVRHLAYPLTMRNAQVINTVRDTAYATATIMDPRPATPKDDLLVLPRIMMTDDTSLAKVLP